MREKSKWQWAFTGLVSTLAVLGWTLHWHVTVNNVHQAPLVRSDGTMTVPECASLKLGMTENQLTAEYGFPRGMGGTGLDSTNLSYPLREDSSRHCEISFGGIDNKINLIAVELRSGY